jgi:hypothetical protein
VKLALSSTTLHPGKITAISTFSDDLRRHSTPAAEARIGFRRGVSNSDTDFVVTAGGDLTIDGDAIGGLSQAANITTAAGTIYNSAAASFPEFDVWTPVLTFATPGDLAVTYAVQVGRYIRKGREMTAHFTIETSAFTWTTAASTLRISGLPAALLPATLSGFRWEGVVSLSGVTKAGYTHFVTEVSSGVSYISIWASGSGVAALFLVAADLPSDGTVRVSGSVTYWAAP